jgi:hypothetical protein
MSFYTTNTIDAFGLKRTSFRGEEAYISFYLESDYVPGKLRSAYPTPVGNYLFCTGINIVESISELPPIQGFNSMTKNLRAPAVVETSLSLNAMYVQEGDPLWMAPGHAPLIAFIDFIDNTHIKKSANDSLNTNLDYTQTVVVRDVRRIKRSIGAQNGAGISYGIDFACGQLITLGVGVMELP